MVRALLAAYGAVYVAAVFCAGAVRHELLGGSELVVRWVELEDLRAVLRTVGLSLFVATIVPWMRWKWVVMCNAHALHDGVERTPRWASWCYFVPVVTFWAPLRCVLDVIGALDVRDRSRAKEIAVAWWVMFTIVRMCDGMLQIAMREGPMLGTVTFEVALGSARVVLAALGFTLVSTVSTAQQRHYEELQAGTGSGTLSP